jgi:hypothetical protein
MSPCKLPDGNFILASSVNLTEEVGRAPNPQTISGGNAALSILKKNEMNTCQQKEN